jgi:hypothetical protein
LAEVSFGPGTCPQCGSFDQAQRVAGIVSSQQSWLSWALTPPVRPGTPAPRPVRRRGSSWGWLLLLLAVLLPLDALILLLLVVLVAAAAAVAAGVVLAGLTAFGVWWVVTYSWRQSRRAEGQRLLRSQQAAYDHALTYWHQLCHCYRCHGVFLPGSEWQREAGVPAGRVTPPEQAWALCCRLADYARRWHAPRVLERSPGAAEKPTLPARPAGDADP